MRDEPWVGHRSRAVPDARRASRCAGLAPTRVASSRSSSSGRSTDSG